MSISRLKSYTILWNLVIKDFRMSRYFVLAFILMRAVGFSQVQNLRNIPFNWKTDLTKHNIELSEIKIAVPRNTFPIIDYPAFVGKEQGLAMFFNQEPVIAVEINGKAKAYSLNMLISHEISNDTLNGVPILPTYCPLCNSGIVYDRRIMVNDKNYLLEFEVSGMLRNSDMIMFDRTTESWWQQLMGSAIVGELTGAEMKILPSLIISVEEFFNRYPKGQILSKNTTNNSKSQYGKNPYENYDKINSNPFAGYFNIEKMDKRLPPKERVIDIFNDGDYKIYPFSVVAKKGVINDQFKTSNVVLFHHSGTVSVLGIKELTQSKNIGSVTVFNSEVNGNVLTFIKKEAYFVDKQTHSKWDNTGTCYEGELKGKQLKIEIHSNHFAFAWFAFHPNSVIYKD